MAISLSYTNAAGVLLESSRRSPPSPGLTSVTGARAAELAGAREPPSRARASSHGRA